MGGTSILGGVKPFAAALYGTAKDPADTVIMRDGVLNGLLHLADEYAQIRCNWCAVSSPPNQGYRGITSGFTADRWYRLGEFGKWPIQLRADGTPYKIRVRLAGMTNGTGTAKFGCAISPPGWDSFWAGSFDSIFHTATTSSGTAGWLTGSSQGSAASGTLVTLPIATDARWSRPVATLDDLAGDPVSVTQAIATLTVFGQNNNASGDARIVAVHASEYVG